MITLKKITKTITPQKIILSICIFGICWCFAGFTKRLSKVSETNTPTILIPDDNSTNNNNPNIKFPPIPSIIGIGPEKCGTTSMAYMLTRNPQKIHEIIKPLTEPTGIDYEMRYWLPCGNRNLNQTLDNVLRDGSPTKPENFCSLGWYQHFWTPQHDDIRFKNQYANSTQTKWSQWRYYYYFEKSPAYWSYDHVAFLFGKLLAPQGTKFFVLIRDPIKRTYSYWSHQSDIGHINTAFRNYVQKSINDKNIKNIINLLKDQSTSITNPELNDKLLKQWTEYVYNKPYGYIGKRDNGHKKRRNLLQYNDSDNSTKRRRLLRRNDDGYIAADSNPFVGVGASCYVVPLLMWMKYVPSTQIILLQSELMYGSNHADFITDVRCWFSLGYEYETMQQCLDDGKKNVIVGEEHMVHSAKGKIVENDAKYLYNEFFSFCNERLKELLSMDKYQHLVLHEMQWDAWYSSGK